MGKYDKYVINPPHLQIKAHEDGRVVFNGMMARRAQLGYDMTLGVQILSKPYVSNNPCHTHNFQEFLGWYSATPDDPEDFGAEVVFYLGEEQEKHVFTRPTIVSLPPGFPHCPLLVTRLERPIIQIEIMLVGDGGTRDPLWSEDKLYEEVVKQFVGPSRPSA
jgi:hypothetical protein